MDTGERLSAYLAGELDADERTALEAELAGDPALRAQLDRLRRTNEILASLPDVAVPAAFSTRLRQAVRDELVELERHTPAGDDLAARRLQRDRRTRWLRSGGLAAAAAAAAAVVAMGVLDTGSDDEAPSAAMDAVREGAPEAGAPFIRVSDTNYSEDEVQELASAPEVAALPDRVDDEAASQLADERAPAFGLETGERFSESFRTDTQGGGTTATGESGDGASGAGGATGSDGQGAVSAEEPEDPAEDTAADQETVPPDDVLEPAPQPAAPRAQYEQDADPFADARRCLPGLLAGASEPVVPLFAEVARFEGQPAILYVLLTREPGDRFLNRLEIWVVHRNDCFTLLYTPAER